LAPGSTWTALGLASAILAVLLASVGVARAGYDRLLLKSVALSSVTMAVVAIAHASLGATQVFGIYQPRLAKPGLLLAPLLNANHLAGHLALGLPLCVAMMLRATTLDGSLGWGAATMMVTAAGLLTLSRGGIAALLTGAAAFLLVQGWAWSKNRRTNPRPLFGLLAAVVCIGFGALLFLDDVLPEFGTRPEGIDKLHVPLELSELLRSYGIAGIGRSALGDVSVSILPWNARVLYTENLPTQWWIEWGIPCGTLIMACFVASLLRSDARQRLQLGMLCGLLALIAQNLVDFSLELPGVAMTASVGLGALLKNERAPRRIKLPSLRAALAPAAGLTMVAILFALPWLTWKGRETAIQALNDAAARRDGSFESLLADALAGYHQDPVFTLLASGRAVANRTPKAGAWLNLVMQRAPGWASPHLQAAVWLEGFNRLDQAALELSLAVDRDSAFSRTAMCEFISRHPQVDLIWQAAPSPSHPRRCMILDGLAHCLVKQVGIDQAPTESLSSMLEECPDATLVRAHLIEQALRTQQAERAIDLALAARPHADLAEATSVLANVYLRLGRPEDADKILREAPKDVRNSVEWLKLAARVATSFKREADLAHAIDALLARHSPTSKARSEWHLFASALFATFGDPTKALSHANAAYAIHPAPTALEQVHRSALAAGVLPAALKAANELCRTRYAGGRYCPPASRVP